MIASCSRTSAAYALTADSSPTCSAAAVVTVCGSATTSLLTGVLDIVVRCLPEDEAREPCRRDDGLQLAPDGDDDVLGGRDDAAHEVHVVIEVAMVDAIDHALHGER